MRGTLAEAIFLASSFSFFASASRSLATWRLALRSARMRLRLIWVAMLGAFFSGAFVVGVGAGLAGVAMGMTGTASAGFGGSATTCSTFGGAAFVAGAFGRFNFTPSAVPSAGALVAP